MKLFQCGHCPQPVFFENTICERCGAPLGYLSTFQDVSALVEEGDAFAAVKYPGARYRYCSNHDYGVCNWLVPATADRERCDACILNRTIPDPANRRHLRAWQEIERAKHRLVYSLLRFGLPLESKFDAPDTGLCFDFLADDPVGRNAQPVITGHTHGVITIDLAEADAARREQTREAMAEPYRTVIGHFRHEAGHYFWDRLVAADNDVRERFRGLFGDERVDYTEALGRYHASGPPADWADRFISAYASSHPWEAWAETWAHYLHLVDTLETAYAFRVGTRPDLVGMGDLNMQADRDPYDQSTVDPILAACIPLFFALNSINRSMGQPDLYPFVIPPPVIDQFRFIHGLIQRHRTSPDASGPS